MKKALALLLNLALTLSVLAQNVDMEQFAQMKMRSIGPAGMSGRIAAIDAVDANPSIIYAGSASGGLWKSTSGGITWKPIFDEQDVHSIGSISIYQKNPNIVWVGTGEGNPRNSLTMGYGVYRSLDAGETWELMGLEKTRAIHRIIVHPDDPNTVFVGAIGSPWGEQEDRGVYKTTDGGKSWEKILYVDEKTGVGEMIMDPNNPNKLFVNMWQHRRYPDFFESGGPSSGLYMTIDGGANWKKLDDSNGLPKGDLGRMGLAISAANSDKVYALIESKKNALYVSEDGGKNFKMINSGSDIGDRPFYYFEIHADPKNENRLYTLYSRVGMSEDGGKSFQQILRYDGVHPDHHAWYINPYDPKLLIDGNDGGLNISRDGGKTWYFAESIPVGQFYHVNVDNELPYNIYGGMQDNGSWAGPSYIWRRDGIRNTYWQEISFGDGFDVVPHPASSRFGYTMSQGGNLSRYDRETGHNRFLKPTHPDMDVFLRFNWNAAIAVDPHDENGVYYGSQFLHKSTDSGETWEIISPDLTTNDSTKQRQQQTGGLTFDITGAENHTTILAIAPSPIDPNVIWVGTDDGNVQVTKDGGQTWTNVNSKLTGLPKGSWIPQIRASDYDVNEAWVVANNYRNNDFSAYAYHTADLGKSFTRIADDSKVWGYALSILQDTEVPELVFLGTEFGLYVSFDKAKTWNKWEHGYPKAVSTYDLALQEREADLVIGTFGRAFYVLDDIRPLREFAKNAGTAPEATLTAVPAPDAYQVEVQQPHGERFPADGKYAGENRDFGGRLTYILNTDTASLDTVTVKIFDAQGTQIRTLKSNPKVGVNRVNWRLDRKSTTEDPGAEDRKGFYEPSGGDALPGTYRVVFEFGEETAETEIQVFADPRIETSLAALKAKDDYMLKLEALATDVNEATHQLDEAEKTIEKVLTLTKDLESDEAKELNKAAKEIKKELEKVKEEFDGPKMEGQGIVRSLYPTTRTRQFVPRRYAGSSYSAPGATEERVYEQAKESADAAIAKTKDFISGAWKEFEEKVKSTRIDLFEEFN
ncbi:WD40/YVTN/BNR-like repeat-containing protein [Algoriphagus namhaensis]